MTTTYDANIPYNSELNYNGGQPLVPPSILPTMGLKVKHKSGAVSPLPDAQVESMSFEDSAVSGIQLSAPTGSVGADLLDDYSIVDLTMNSKPVQDGRWLLRGKDWNAGLKTQLKSYSGKMLLWDRLDRTRVWNNKRYLYAAKSPGFILNDLFGEAQSRDVGYWDEFTWTFDTTVDSAGRAWPLVISIEYLPTAKYSDIVANMVDKGLIDIHLLGDEIQVFVKDTSGVATNALLVVGKDLSGAPQKSSSDNIVSDLIILGDDGVSVVRSNTETRAAYWREEDGISQGGTKDTGTLSIIGDVGLSAGDSPRVQRTYELVVTHERPFLPLRDYVVGDWVRCQHADEGVQAYRVKQIVLKQDGKKWTGSLVLNDKFIEHELRLAKRVDGIIGGATITGTAQTSTPEDLRDDSVPNPPTGVVGTSVAYVDDNGVTRSSAEFVWVPPTHNTDGTPVVDLYQYQAIWKYNGDTVWQWQYTPDAQFAVTGLDPNRELLFFVRAIDKTGWWSANQPTPYVLLLEGDTTPPPAPSGPLLLSILRMLVVEWNGLTVSGGTMPSDLDHIDVYTSRVNDFDVDQDGTLRGTLQAKGQLALPMYSDLPGTTIYVKFVAVDRSGNRSPASAQNTSVINGVSGPDITANSITANNLAVGSVTAQAIAAGAITSQKISVGQTQNLVVDPSFNDPDWRAKRLTTTWAENPARWFFTTGFIDRNGHYLQALSTADGVNGGRMYVTDYIYTQLGESYYFGMYMRTGQFMPNAEATIRMGVEVTHADGTIQSDGINYLPMTAWTKYGYRFTIINQAWVKLRFYIQGMELTAGDIAIDDLEVRGGVGTTEYSGSRGLLDPLGMYAYDANDEQTFLVDFRTGDVTARGTIASGFSGKRTVINPGSTYLPEIRFYPSTGDLYAYINATETASFPFIGINAPDDPVTEISNALIMFDNDIVLGAIDKNNNQVQSGLAIFGTTKATSEVALYGKLTYSNEAHRMFSGGRWNFGSHTSGGGSLVPVLGKPNAPSAGVWILLATVQWNAGEKMGWHITGEAATTVTMIVHPPGATWVTAGSIPFYLNFMFVRADTV